MSSEPGPARVLVVTGASSGIGRSAAHLAAARGDRLVLVSRSRPVLEEVREECERLGAASVSVAPTDVADDAAVADLVRETLEQHGRIDAVIHSAGVAAYGRTDQLPADVFEGVVRTNVLGSAAVARHVLPVMREQGRGVLVLVGSVVGHLAVPSMPAYAVSKWAVRSLARQLRLEVRGCPDVHVCYLAPGGVDTPIYEQAANYHGPVGRPPFPVASTERVARRALALLEHPRRSVQVGLANGPLRAMSAVAPAVSDRVLATLFPIGATDLTQPVEPGPGNVSAPRPAGESVRGHQGSALLSVLRNLRATIVRRRQR